jgi:hypothetical protein
MRLLSLACVLLLSGVALAAGSGGIAYPDGYRHWTHVKTMLIEPGHPLFGSFGGIHHLYANDKAMEGYRSGRFPDGARIVFDLLAADSHDHAVTEGTRKFTAVMVKDERGHAATGGWGFEAFAGDSHDRRTVGADAAKACFACHASQKAHDYVFSTYRP